MLYKIENETPVRVSGKVYRDADGTQHVTRALDQSWPDADLAAIELYRVERVEPDENSIVTGRELVFEGGRVLDRPIERGRTIEESRDQAFERIKRARDKHIASGISVSGVHVHTDDLSQQRLVGAALAATIDPETTINWKMSDGQFATLSGTQIIGIAQAVRDHVQAAFDTEAMLRAQINAAETIEEIDAVEWPHDP